MKSYSVFDIIGPRMVGPSSSHTAGAVRLGIVAYKMVKGNVVRARVILYGSFAQTGKGHGTDKAIVAGLLGMEPDNPGLRNSILLAQETKKDIQIEFSSKELDHPNSAQITVENSTGVSYTIIGSSIGGGNINITEINGMEVSFSCEYPTLLVFHNDKPGIITHVTGVLALKEINIAFMKVFRSAKSMSACMVIETDTPVSDDTVLCIKNSDNNIMEVCSI